MVASAGLDSFDSWGSLFTCREFSFRSIYLYSLLKLEMKIFKRAIKWSLFLFLPPALALALLYSIDQRLHEKYADSFGLNQRGYRGELLSEKSTNELRIVTLGGSTTFGYGVKTPDAWPSQLSSYINNRIVVGDTNRRKISVANLGYNNEGAFAYEPNLRSFSHLDYDIVLFFTGVNDLGGPNYTVFRSDPIFRTFGYFSLLPIVLAEKARLIESEGSLEDAYLGQAQTSNNYFKRVIAKAMKAIAKTFSPNRSVSASTDLKSNFSTGEQSESAICKEVWRFYCASLVRAINYALDKKALVIVISEPIRGNQVQGQRDSVASLVDQFIEQGTENLHWLDYTNLLDLENAKISFDKMHLTREGNAILAKQVSKDLIALVFQDLPRQATK